MKDLKPVGVKAPLALLPRNALCAIAGVIEHGAQKYAPWNWMDNSQAQARVEELHNALLRHVYSSSDPSQPDIDEESGIHHLAHAGACILILLYKLGIDYVPSNFVKAQRDEGTTTMTEPPEFETVYGDAEPDLDEMDIVDENPCAEISLPPFQCKTIGEPADFPINLTIDSEEYLPSEPLRVNVQHKGRDRVCFEMPERIGRQMMKVAVAAQSCGMSTERLAEKLDEVVDSDLDWTHLGPVGRELWKIMGLARTYGMSDARLIPMMLEKIDTDDLEQSVEATGLVSLSERPQLPDSCKHCGHEFHLHEMARRAPSDHGNCYVFQCDCPGFEGEE